MKARLVRPWILFPYKSLKTQIALTLTHLLLWLSNYRNLLICGCSFMWCKLLVLFMFVYDKNKGTPFCMGSIDNHYSVKRRLINSSGYLLNLEEVKTCFSIIWNQQIASDKRSNLIIHVCPFCLADQWVVNNHSPKWRLTLSLPRAINFNFLFQSFTRDITYSMENLVIDTCSLLRWKFIEQSFLTTSFNHFLLEWLGEFA